MAIVAGWHGFWQFMFLVGFVCLVLLVGDNVLSNLGKFAAIIFRGYPPPEAPKSDKARRMPVGVATSTPVGAEARAAYLEQIRRMLGELELDSDEAAMLHSCVRTSTPDMTPRRNIQV
jgi:hypothetical protein